MPTDVALVIGPGTAITGRSRSTAASTVYIEPPEAPDSTTTSTSLSAATMRLRAGKCHCTAGVPERILAEQRSVLCDIRPQRPVGGRVHAIQPAANDTDDRTALIQRGTLCDAIDASGKA